MNAIHSSAEVYDGVKLADQVTVEEFSVLGKDQQDESSKTTIVQKGSCVGTHATVYAGSTIQSDVVIDDYSRIGYDSLIGSKSRIIYGSHVYSRVNVGECCIVGGFLCNDCNVGDRSRIFGAVFTNTTNHISSGGVLKNPHRKYRLMYSLVLDRRSSETSLLRVSRIFVRELS